MARSYGKIVNSLWTSRKFRLLRGKDRPRLLYLFLHTCPQRNSVGCFNCQPGHIAVDMGWTEGQVSEAIEKLREVHLIDWNADEEMVRIVDFVDHDPPTNLKHAESMAVTAMQLPDCVEKARAIGDLLKNGHSAAVQGLKEEHDRLLIAYPYTTDILIPLPTPLPRTKSSLRSDSAGAPKTKIPEDWPSDHSQELARKYWREAGRDDLVPKLEAEMIKARAHHRAKGTRSPDWPAVWVTWYSRAVEYNRPPAKNTAFPTATIHKVA